MAPEGSVAVSQGMARERGRGEGGDGREGGGREGREDGGRKERERWETARVGGEKRVTEKSKVSSWRNARKKKEGTKRKSGRE